MGESALEFMIQHGGVGSIFGLISGYVALRLWQRNNELQDSKAEMVEQLVDIIRQEKEQREHIKGILARIEKELNRQGE